MGYWVSLDRYCDAKLQFIDSLSVEEGLGPPLQLDLLNGATNYNLDYRL